MEKKNLSSNEISGTYHFLKTWDGYQMSKETYQPLSVQNNRALVPYDESQVMIEVQHCVKLVFVFYEANFPGKRLELYYIWMIDIASYQSFNHFLKVQPSRRQQNAY